MDRLGGGFGFTVDYQSHRLTGFMQIRSKEQVQMVERVRGWLREWQEDLARTGDMTEDKLASHKPSRAASYVYSFIQKAKEMVVPIRSVYLSSVLAGKTTMNVLLPERAPLQDQFDVVVDKSCLIPHDDSFFSKFSKVSYKRPVEVSGSAAVGQLHRWMENGLKYGGP